MKRFIGIASAGRPGILADTLETLRAQTVQPDAIFICTPDDDPDEQSSLVAQFGCVALKAPRGSCAQRNGILDRLGAEQGILVIIDDDFILAPAFLEAVGALMAAHPDIAILNANIIADGIIGPGIKLEDARRLVAMFGHQPTDPTIEDCRSIYGCNMTINLELARSVRFDETLPLYGWQEDVDFSHQLKRYGRVAKTNLQAGVHLGVKKGRTPGVKFGYSQIVNPFYLVRKGTMSFGHGFGLAMRNIAMNMIRSLRPEPYIDRRGRLLGNIKGLAAIMSGRADPRRILDW
jgi:hypothetical protein